MDCQTCFQYGGQQCLFDSDYKHHSCCDLSPNIKKTMYCRYFQYRNTYCANSKTIQNKVIQNWTCKAHDDKCPHDYHVEIDGIQEVARSHTWNFIVPDPTAVNWNCKYHVSLSQKMVDQYQKDKKDLGYIMVQIEQYGFDEDVSVIV